MKHSLDIMDDEPAFILRRLSVSEIWSQTWAVFMKRYELFLIIASLSYIMIIIIYGATVTASGDMNDAELHHRSGLVFVELCIYHLINIIGHAAMSRAVGEVYMGRVPILHECLMQGLQVCCPLVGVWTIVTVAFLVAYYIILVFAIVFNSMTSNGTDSFFALVFFLGSIFGVLFVMGMTSLVTPTATIEKRGVIGILQRDVHLVSQNVFFVVVTIVVLDVIRIIVDILIKAIFFGTDADMIYSVTGVMISKVTVLLFAPLLSIMQTLVYFNIRIENEGFNERVLGQQLEGQVGSTVADPVSSPSYTPVSLGTSEVSLNNIGGNNASPLVSAGDSML